jgi:hypothetical protein
MGSFLSSLSSNPPPPDDFGSMEMEPLSRSSGRRTGQLDSDLDYYSGRRYPLNPNGGGSANLLQGFRRRLRTSATTQIHVQSHQEWDLEISGPEGARTSDGSHEVTITALIKACDLNFIQNNIDQPLNFKLGNLTAFNIDNRDRTIEQLQNELKELRRQLRNARKASQE